MNLSTALFAAELLCGLAITFSASADSEQEIARLVFESISSANTFNDRSLANYRELRKNLNPQKCSGLKYAQYRVDDTVYVIGTAKNRAVIGRHFKFNVVNNEADLSSISSSTKSCLALEVAEPGGSNFVTHLLSPRPTEFHAITSLLSGSDLYVSCESGLWKVVDGIIQQVEK